LKHVIIAGKRREFPSFLERSKQVNVSIKWIKELVMENKERLLYHRILAELIEIYRVKRHVLFKRRDEIFAEAVKNRFNLRYSF
jgi:ribosomal protein S7